MSLAAVLALRAAKAKIIDPATWTKGAMSRGEGFASLCRVPASATCFCADGALIAVADTIAGGLQRTGASLFLSNAARRRGFDTASRMNDAEGTTHVDILALFDDAIRRAEGSMVLLALTGGARGWV